MADAEVSLKFSADASEAEKQMESLRETLNKLSEITERADKYLAGLQDKAAQASAEVLEMRARLNEQNGDSPMSQQWEDRMNRFTSLDIRADHYASQFAGIGEELQKLDDQFVQGELSVKDYEAALKDISKEARQNMKGLTQLRGEVEATNTILHEDGHLGQVAELYARLSQRVLELGSKNEEMGMAFSRSAAQLQEQAAALDTSSAAGQKHAQTLMRAAEQAQQNTDRTSRLNSEITKLAMQLDAVTKELGGKNTTQDAVQKLEEYGMKLDQLGVKVEAVERREGAAGAVRENVAQQVAAAAAKESAAEQQAALQMQYGAMSRKQLIEVMRQLIQARQEAASAGKLEAVQEYTSRISVARSALQNMNQELNLMRVQLLQKAQLGLQAANSLQILGQQAASGAMNFGSMANAAMSFGYALKVGLGPVGWALAAIQGIGSAISWWNKVSDENRQKVEDSRKAHEELKTALRAANQEAYNSARKKYYEDELKGVEEVVNARTELANTKKEENDAAAQRRLQESQQDIENQRKLEQEQFANVQALAQTRIALGDRTAQQELEQERQRHEQKMSDLDEEEAKAGATYAEDKLRNANEQARLLREAAETKFDKVLSFDTTGMQSELQKLDKTIDLLSRQPDLTGEREEAVARRNAILDEAKKIVEALQAIDPNLRVGGREAIAFVEAVRNSRMSAQNLAGELERLGIPELQNEVEGAKKNMARVKDQAARKALAMASEPVKLEGNYKLEDTRTQQEIQQTDIQRLNAKKQQLEKTLESVEAGSQEAQLVQDSLATLKTQQKAIQDTLARREREKGWEEAQEGSLREQQKYVERMLASVKEGTVEWEKWANASRGLANTAVQQELERIRAIGRGTGGTENLAAQKNLLQQQQRALRELASRTGLSASTQSEISKELTGVQSAAAQWRANLSKSAAEGQKKLLNTKAPDGQAANKTMQGNLDMLQKQWPKLAEKLEKAAREGDTKGMKRVTDQLRQNAKTSERLTGNTGSYADAFTELVQAARDLKMSGDKRTSDDRKKNDVDRKLDDPLESRKAKQEQRKFEADQRREKRKEDAQEKATQRAGKQTPLSQKNAQPQPQKGQQQQMPNVDLSPANEATEQAAQALQQVSQQAQQLSGAMQGVASAAENIVSAYQSLQKEVQSIKEKLSKLSTRV